MITVNNIKTYFANIYRPSVSGMTTSGILSSVNDFAFSGFQWNINGGLGETKLRFARKFNSFGENSDIAVFNQVDIYISDKESGSSGRNVYSGYITEYTPVLNGSDEYVDVTLWGYPTEFTTKVLETGTDTTIAYNSVDPSTIVKDAINRYDGKVTYSPTSIDLTGTVTSYTFKQNTIQEVIDQAVDLSPVYWYWVVGADNVLNFHVRDTTVVNHTLFIGKDIKSVKATRSIKDMRNGFYFLGGGAPIYIKSTRTASQSTYGKRSERQVDARVTLQSTAQTIATTFLDFYDHPLQTVEVEVVDSNGDMGGYDIESFVPGQIVKIVDPMQSAGQTLWDVAIWDIDSWDFNITSALGIPMQIRSINYGLESATLQLSYEVPDFSKRIEDIIRNLEYTQTQNTPTTPTLV